MGQFSFKLPDVGEGIAQVEIVAWHVNPGDLVSEDQPLADVMTDKATVELTSPVQGRVLSINGGVGDQAVVGSIIAVLEVDGHQGETEPVQSGSKPAGSVQPPPSVAASEPDTNQVASPSKEQEIIRAEADARASQKAKKELRPLASPSVRRRAFESKIDLSTIVGTGPEGRILHTDLDDVLSQPKSAGGAFRQRENVEEVRVIGLRRKIAEKMSISKRKIPHFSYIEEVDVTDLEKLRAQLNELYGKSGRLTLLPFVTRALVILLPEFPQLNALYDDEAGIVRRHSAIHLGIATQTPAGLAVPVVRHAETLSLWQTAAEISRVAEAARTGKATREEMNGSTITITSLGPIGGIAHTPVINHPEVAIIGPNKIAERPVVRSGEIVIRKIMNISSSFDHRVVDGWDAANFIQRLKALLETPALLFTEKP